MSQPTRDAKGGELKQGVRTPFDDFRKARRAYQRFVEAGIEDPPRSPEKVAVGGMFLGRASWVEQMRERLADEPTDINVPQRKGLAWRPTRAEIVRQVKEHFGADCSSDLTRVRRHGNDARVAAIYLIRRLTDEKVTTLAKQFGGVSVAAISKLLSRAELRREEDPNWDGLLEELERKCRKDAPA